MSIEEILSLDNIETLQDLKEDLKNKVVSNINWQERIELYRRIQIINDQIQRLCLTEV